VSLGRKLLPTVLILVSVVLSLALCEAALRWINFSPARELQIDLRATTTHDPVRGWRNRPGTEAVVSTPEFKVMVRYNGRGIRGPEVTLPKPPGVYRILLLGDSFTDASALAQEDRVSENLARMLNAGDARRRYDVVPMGNSGYSTDQELLWLEAEGLDLSPDLVILMFYENDLTGNVSARHKGGAEKPLFRFQNGALTLTNVPVPLPGDRTPANGSRTGQTRPWIDRLRFRLRAELNETKTAELVRHTIAYSPRLRKLLGVSGTLSNRLDLYRRSPGRRIEEGWRVTEALLARMKAGLGKAGVPLHIFFIPARWSVEPEEWVSELTLRSLEAAEYDPNEMARRMVGICERLSLTCLEPTARFVEAAREGKSKGENLYYRVDPHWNRNGHRVAAEILAQHIRRLRGAVP